MSIAGLTTDAFLLRLTDLYSQHAVFGLAEPEPRALGQSPKKRWASMDVTQSTLRTPTSAVISGPHGAATGHTVQDHFDVQDAPWIVAVADGVPPGKDDPLSRADTGYTRSNILRPTYQIVRSGYVNFDQK